MRSTMMEFPLTLHHIFDRGTTLFPEQEIVTGGANGTHRYTYRDFRARVRGLAAGLSRLGVRPGDRIASFAWNTYRHHELYFAVPMIGAVLHTINIRLFRDQISHIVNHAGDRMIFADRSLLPLLGELRPTFRPVERFVSMEDGSAADPGDALDYEAILADDGGFAFPRVGEREAAMMCYTSGTTGNPKGVLYSHRALVLHSFGAAMVDTIALSQRDTCLAIVPMFHVNAWGTPFTNIFVGAKQVHAGVAPKPETLLALLEQEGVTIAAGVPTVFLGLQAAIASGKHDLSRLKRIVIGGSAVPPNLMEAYDRLGITIVHAWGMTETTPLGLVGALKKHLLEAGPAEQLARRLKQGLPVPGIELRAIDDEGREVPHDGQTMGELVARGPWVTGSYYHDPRTADAFTPDGWFRTGDVVTIDPEGYVQIADRTKDLIKSGGEWISSVELENALMAHPKVLEAAVVAAPDGKWGERPLACVVPRPEARGAVADEELNEHLRARVAKWWLPDRYVYLDELPKTSVGKFDKKVLRQRFAAETTLSP
ncbi:MAG TPA: long-chain fatty acid--CoA ligase [Chloroflexota bacterium]|jgi:fatty-acyl-CoA synthase|nr:long-chain fatty acid--CoA ligase [Chloroflexota bacterium]